MMKSLFSGVSGLKNHTVRMDVIGNNIANVNTTAYKANTVTFRDVFYQTRNFASAGSAVNGGTNPRQVGYGLAMGSIDKVMTQSGLTFSDNDLDCAIVGEGFFQVMDPAGNIFYTRNGVFNIDNAGNLVDSNGFIVLGVNGDPTGIGPSSQRIALMVPNVMNERANWSNTIEFNGAEYDVQVEASGYGPNGNIAINIVHSRVPFASLSGNVLTIEMDLTRSYASPAQFNDALNAAISAGGVNPGDGVLPLNVTISGVPAEGTDPLAAYNYFEFGDTLLRFEAFEPGEAANRYQVNLATSTSIQSVTARWNQGVMTITVPTREWAHGDTHPTEGVLDEDNPAHALIIGTLRYPTTLEDIQNAVNAAAGMQRVPDPPSAADIAAGLTPGQWRPDSGDAARKLIISTGTTIAEGNTNAATARADFPNGTVATPAGFVLALEIGPDGNRIGFDHGEDSFYRGLFDRINMPLTNGRFAGPQTVRDLEVIFIDSGGVIYGEHAVHGTLLLGRIDIAIFQNQNGLQHFGTSYFRTTPASGEAEVKIPESDGAGEISSGSLEMANVDLSEEFSNMIITQRGFQANSRIITVSDTMLEELINLKR
ncbi:MAG: flagellar hook-basal body complex protein [Oscillospiraceae bacterium]|nr:flagellar hook-basal body complex protein [Oscillospiraceae bacterium]